MHVYALQSRIGAADKRKNNEGGRIFAEKAITRVQLWECHGMLFVWDRGSELEMLDCLLEQLITQSIWIWQLDVFL